MGDAIPADGDGPAVVILDLYLSFFLQQELVLLAPCGRGVKFEPRIVLERQLDAPEVIEVPMREHHEIDLALPLCWSRSRIIEGCREPGPRIT